MPPKAKMPQPIDRPLSRAYLREFGGWSTAYPPGASDPTSLRIMENMQINRDGSVRIRPGLKRLTTSGDLSTAVRICSAQEPFYLNNGKKAYLIAVRETVGPTTLVTFRVGIQDPVTEDIVVVDLLHAEVAFDITGWATLPFFSDDTTYVKFLQIDNKILALSNAGEPFIVFHVGAVKKVPELLPLTHPTGPSPGTPPEMFVPSGDWVSSPFIGRTRPTMLVGGESATSLQSNNPALNTYNVAAFYTFSNELGESYSSALAHVKVQYPFGQYSTKQSDAGVGQAFPNAFEASSLFGGIGAAHQLIVQPSPAHDAAVLANLANGATKINFYFMHWSAQDSVPVEALLFKTIDLTPTTPVNEIYASINFSTLDLGKSRPIPATATNLNTTGPTGAGQGIVAADRLVLVNDPTAAAVIRWTGNNMGDYLNFDAMDGGGYKTLTSGNLQIPACVKLWQNPQSADTLTVLNKGTDGYSSAYYMAPASVSSQSDNTIIMGFEETTATPGTVSPYGCEVANNALYHPLEDQLMKSTASNYNISHKSMTDQIANKWSRLINKDKIVSCFHDQRLFFLVHNPDGEALEAGCMGNEVWVLDLAAEGGNWSRWLTQGVSLRKIEHNGLQRLTLVRPDGIFAFDLDRALDDKLVEAAWGEHPISWRLESNTQGANRAHDAFAHLQQANLVLGNFTGTMRFGVRGVDIHGQRIRKSKVIRNVSGPDTDGLPWDLEDFLLIERDMKEWFLFASSETVDDVVQPSGGQLTLVQYRYAPISVNVGYEFGSVETFEYRREGINYAGRTTDNGVPQPYLATERP